MVADKDIVAYLEDLQKVCKIAGQFANAAFQKLTAHF